MLCLVASCALNKQAASLNRAKQTRTLFCPIWGFGATFWLFSGHRKSFVGCVFKRKVFDRKINTWSLNFHHRYPRHSTKHFVSDGQRIERKTISHGHGQLALEIWWSFRIRLISRDAVLRSHVVCPSVCLSVCLSVCDVRGSGPHRLKIWETNCANN